MKSRKWTRLLSGLLVCVMLLSMIPIAGAETNTYLFEDDFSGDLNKWTVTQGSAKVENGQMIATAVAQYSPADTTLVTTGDLVIEFEGKPSTNWVGFQFNMASTGANNWSTTGYFLYVRPDGTADLLRGGPQTPLVSNVVVPNFSASAMTKVKVEYTAANGNIKVYFNDSATASIDTTDTTYTEGYFGVAAGAKNVVFDNVKVQGTKKTDSSEPELEVLDLSGAAFEASTKLEGHPTLSGTPIDGSLTTGWTSNPSTSNYSQEEWCQIVLTKPVTLSRLDLYPRWDTANIYGNTDKGPLAFPEEFDILVSSNGTSWTTVKSVTGHTVTAQEWQTFTFDAQENVKYIKLVSKKMSCEGTLGGYRFQLMEMKAFGAENETEAAERVEVSLTGSAVTVSSFINNNDTWAPANAIDGNAGKGWSSDGPRTTADYNEWIQLELPAAASVSEVVLVPRYGHGNNNVDQFLCFPQDFTIQVSSDGTNWDTVVSKTGYVTSKQEGEVFSFMPRNNVKFIKVDATRLNHEGNTGYSSFRFQLMEMKAYYTPMSIEEVAASITSLEVDYQTDRLVLPVIPGYSIEIASSSNPDVIAENCTVDVVNGGTSNIVLKVTDGDNNSALTTTIPVTVIGVLESMSQPGEIASATATSSHSAWPDSHLTNGNTSNGFWSNGDNAPEQVEIVAAMKEAAEITGVVLYPRVSPAESSGATHFPENFEIFVSADQETWTSVKKVSNYPHNNSTEPQTFSFSGQKQMKYVKLVIDRGGQYVQIAEIEVLTMPVVETAAEAADKLTAEQKEDTLVLGNITKQFKTEITRTEPSGIVAADGKITLPAQDTEVTLTIQVTNRLNTNDTVTVIRKVLVKSQATLDVEAVAETVDLIPCPANDATQLTLPSVPAGYTIAIAESDHPNVVGVTGKITRSDDTTYGVRLTFKITNTATGASALTDALLVPIYKTYVAPTMTQAEIDKIHEEYEDNAYGVFVHYISNYSAWGGTVYADGTPVDTVDEAANAFDAAAFAKSMDEFGVEYVVLTLWHGDARPLFPSMTSQRWRDDRRAEGSTTKKSYADRDVIMDLLDELDKYDIDLHLYTHPTDGHDFTTEDQKLTGANNSSGNYAVWNQYINELYYEVCERYGTRIKGLWFDGVYGRTSGAANQARLRATCLSFNPGMILTMNTGFTEGNLNPAPGYTCPDYRAWEVNRYVDFVNDMRFSRYQSAIVLASKGWWTTVSQNTVFNVQPAEDVFQYIVAMSSVSTHGGFLASTGFYPVREGEDLKGNYFMNGIRDMLLKVNNSYLTPVEESIKNTNNSTAYPTTENICVKDLEWGVANESKDGRYIYLHVLNAPEGDTLTLPATKDGTTLRNDAVIMNFDGTTTPVTITKTDNGYSITLPEGVAWSEVDTVIKAERSSVTGVTVDESLALEVGESDTLIATVSPDLAYDKSLVWSSSDEDVASVDATGKVTAVAEGTATITVTTADGGYTDTCAVTVNDTAVSNVEALITAIGEVTLESEEAIKAARAAYDALSEAQKGRVDNDTDLTAAEKDYDDLVAADYVDTLIDSIGKVTLGSKSKIEAARKAYDALSDNQKALVSNRKTLEAAEAEYRKQVILTSMAIAGAADPVVEFPFVDVPETAWFYDEVKEAWENDLIDGMNETQYMPDNTLTVAQAIKLAAALHQMYFDSKVTLENGWPNWYDSYVDYAIYNGIIEAKYDNYNLTQMNAAISREEFVHIFFGAMNMDAYYACNSVADNAIPDVKMNDTFASEIYTFYRAGILTGSDAKGTFHPDSNIKRSEVAAILIRMYDTNVRQAVTLG